MPLLNTLVSFEKKINLPEYQEFYQKKFAELTIHQHKRVLAPTSCKLIPMIFELLVKNQLYS